MRFTIDTGASIIVLNGRDARALGLDARNGVPSRIRTASGAAAMRLHRLERLSVAGLELYDVEVAVVENGGPQASLLGLNILGAFGKVSISGQELEITP
jgi:clan AA aspartic protease (TIGR02281 family)